MSPAGQLHKVMIEKRRLHAALMKAVMNGVSACLGKRCHLLLIELHHLSVTLATSCMLLSDSALLGILRLQADRAIELAG